MPTAPLKPCAMPGCKELTARVRCAVHEQQRAREYRKRRPAEHRFYKTARWLRFRKRYLASNPLCVACKEHGVITPATDVDHVIPLRQGGRPLAWRNVRALCHSHHSQRTGRDTGFPRRTEMPVHPVSRPDDVGRDDSDEGIGRSTTCG